MNELDSDIPEVDCRQAQALLDQGWQALDVREPAEYSEGQIPGAINAPLSQLQTLLAQCRLPALSNKQRPLLIYCAAGVRSCIAAEWLLEDGFTRVASLKEGMNGWKARQLPLSWPDDTDPDAERYARQMVLDEVGIDGQKRLQQSRVLLVGAGGLGSPVAWYLAAAGVGRLTLVDDDRVERSNLQRQILHTDAAVGESKVYSARRSLHALNPDIHIESLTRRLDDTLAEEQFPEHDLIIDGSDNFTTRYCINRACTRLKKPFIYGAVQTFSGQAALLTPGRREQACYRCLYPQPPENPPTCAEAGVLGAMVGWVGTLQANLALQWLLGLADPLRGRLLLADGREMTVRKVSIPPDPACPECGTPASRV